MISRLLAVAGIHTDVSAIVNIIEILKYSKKQKASIKRGKDEQIGRIGNPAERWLNAINLYDNLYDLVTD